MTEQVRRTEPTRDAAHQEAGSGLYLTDEPSARWLVRAYRCVAYEVRIRDRVFDPENLDVLEVAGRPETAARRLLVVDRNVDRVHGPQIREYLHQHGVPHRILVVHAEEGSKHLGTVVRVAEEMDAFGLMRRSEPVIVVGGGVLMDVVGLAASLYRRGTPLVRVPTTLVGLVDAGVGAKTGVNFNGGKNRLGTYAPAELTLLDRRFLSSLPQRHISNGLGEILKIALIKDKGLFELLETHGGRLVHERFQGLTEAGDEAALAALRAATHAMLEELQPNLWETDLERAVDYGHTFSPRIEMQALPELLHGEAVAVDMALTTLLAQGRRLVSDDEQRRVFAVLDTLGLPSWDPVVTHELLVDALRETTLHRDGRQRLPLPVGIGDVTFVDDVTDDELVAALHLQCQWGSTRRRQG